MKKKQFLKLFSCIIAMGYSFFPLVQYLVYDDYDKKFNSYNFFFISSWVLRISDFLFAKSIVTYLVPFVLWILIWWLLYLLLCSLNSFQDKVKE
jgi:hypothetical protein